MDHEVPKEIIEFAKKMKARIIKPGDGSMHDIRDKELEGYLLRIKLIPDAEV